MQNQSYSQTIPQSGVISASQPASSPAAHPRVEIVTQFRKAESLWHEMIQQGAITSRYQHYSWMSQWWQHVGQRGEASPHIAILKNGAGQPALLLPLLRKRMGALHVGMFAGGKHTNFNLPVWRPDLMSGAGLGPAALLDGMRDHGPRIDLLVLMNQPATWRGAPNPMLELPHSPSPSQAYGGALLADFDALRKERMGSSSRKKLAQKERQLATLGPVSYMKAKTPGEIDRILEAFLLQKAARMRELGLRDAFDAAGVKEFVTACAHDRDGDTGLPVIELYAGMVGDTIIATFGGIVADGRFSGMFNSMAGAEFREYSPGELLLSQVVKSCCERGLDRFDLGIGEAGYKQVYCKDVEALYDSVIPITMLGHAAAPLWRASLAIKRKLKRSNRMLRTARTVGNLVSRRTER